MSKAWHELYSFDRQLRREKGIEMLAGVDEAGRGPLAGPVVAAAVILDPHPAPGTEITGLDDSKKLSPGTRARILRHIRRNVCALAVAASDVEEIERSNIRQATLNAMTRALKRLSVGWDHAVIDGNCSMSESAWQGRLTTCVGGDRKSASVAAASIVAKQVRDRLMRRYHYRYPEYGFDRHAGYGTQAHRDAILRFGLCAQHRSSFCRRLVQHTRLQQSELALDGNGTETVDAAEGFTRI